MPLYQHTAASSSYLVDESGDRPTSSLSRNSTTNVPLHTASGYPLMASSSATQQLEQKSVPADVANTLEHIVSQLDILTQVLAASLSLCAAVILMINLSVSCLKF